MEKLVEHYFDKFNAIQQTTNNNRTEQTAMLMALARTFGRTMAILGKPLGDGLLAAATAEAARFKKLL